MSFLNIPNEILEIILSNIKDPVNLSNCRKTCKLFNYILTNRNRNIENIKQISKNKSLNIDFLNSFLNIKILDFPVKIRHFTDLYEIGKLNISKFTFQIDKKDNVSLLLFLLDYNREKIRKYKNLKNTVFKIIQGKTIRWITNKKYAVYNADFEISDNYLIKICCCETLITNSRYSLYSSVKNIIYLSTIEKLKFIDYIPPLHIKSYSWRPIASQNKNKINKLKNLSRSITSLLEVRPNVIKYEMPILPKHYKKMKDIFFNAESFGILHEKRNSKEYEDNLVYYYSSKNYHKNGIDLDNPPDGEDYIDSLFKIDL